MIFNFNYNAWCEHINSERKRQHLSIDELMNRANLNKSYYDKIMRGDSTPSMYSVIKLSEVLGCHLILDGKVVDYELLIKSINDSIKAKHITKFSLAQAAGYAPATITEMLHGVRYSSVTCFVDIIKLLNIELKYMQED